VDRAISVAFFDPVARRFPLKASWWLAKAGHEGLKWLMVAFWLLCLAWRPLRLGAAYMALGAHFASHVLWTAWVAWGVTLAAAALRRGRPPLN
jgi:membrane-associated PAP2 superfamily phosphatase